MARGRDVECGGRTPLGDWETCLPVQSADMSAHSTLGEAQGGYWLVLFHVF